MHAFNFIDYGAHLSIDESARKVYYVSYNSNSIKKMNFDGSGLTSIVDTFADVFDFVLNSQSR